MEKEEEGKEKVIHERACCFFVYSYYANGLTCCVLAGTAPLAETTLQNTKPQPSTPNPKH